MSRSNTPSQPGAWPAPAQERAGQQDMYGQPTGGRAAQRTQPQAPANPAPAYPPQQSGHYDSGYVQPAYPRQPAPNYPAERDYTAAPPQFPTYPAAPQTPQGQSNYGHQPGFGYPQHSDMAADPYAHPAPQQPAYAPQFAPYQPPVQPSYDPGAYHQAPHEPAFEHEPVSPFPLPQQGYAPSAPEPGLSQLSLNRGRSQTPPSDYNRGFAAHDQIEPWPQPAEPQQARGYEQPVSSYHDAGYEPAFGRAGAAPAPQQEPAFGNWQATRDQYAGHEPAFPDLAFETTQVRQAQVQDMGQFQVESQAVHHGGALAASYEQDEGDYEDEEPKKRSSWLMVAAALSAAIVVGGGAAFVYQKLLSGKTEVAAPLIKGDPSPSKMKPAEAGGKQFAHTGSKVMGRLADGGAPADAGPTDVDASGARRVMTVPVSRDGSLVAAPPVAAPPIAPSVAVPGLTIVDGFGRAQPATAAAPPTAAPVVVQPPQPPPAAVTPQSLPAAAPAKPVVIARAAAPVVPAAPPAEEVAPAAPVPPKTAVKKPPAPPKKKVVDAYGAATGSVPAAPAASAPSGSSGFVPVLISIPAAGKTNADALASFADMRARYAGVLDGREPVIKEIDRGDKGLYYRVMAGPPGSKEQADALCSQLKAQGHKDCWVSGY